MKRRIFIFIFILKFTVFYSQIYEIGLMGGASNYIGDIGRTNYVYPENLAFGIIYKWNKSTRHSYRFTLVHTKIEGNDQKSDLNYRLQRGFQFTNTITEASVGLEFNFFDFDLHHLDHQFTPYVATGISGFMYDSKYYVTNIASTYEENTKGIAIPMIVGVKTRLSERFVLGIELGARYTFTDNLDGTNPKRENISFIKTGNRNSNDWYIFSLATLTYTFGKNPCFCPL